MVGDEVCGHAGDGLIDSLGCVLCFGSGSVDHDHIRSVIIIYFYNKIRHIVVAKVNKSIFAVDESRFTIIARNEDKTS